MIIADLSVRDDSASRQVRLDDFAITPANYQAAIMEGKRSVGERVAAGFGSTCAKIGILIALAAIIGMCLLESGAAERIVRSSVNFVGEKLAPLAFMASGFLLAIPVFFDTVFYLLIPLGKAMRFRTGKNYLLYVLAIVTGGTMAHSLGASHARPVVCCRTVGRGYRDDDDWGHDCRKYCRSVWSGLRGDDQQTLRTAVPRLG